MVLSLPNKIWNYLYVIIFSFNFLDKIISIIWCSVCGCLCQWSGWLGENRELNPVFYILPAICIFLPVCWSHTLKSLLRTLFQFSEFSLCYLDSCFLFSSFLPLVSQASLSQHYGFCHYSAFLLFFPGASFISVLSWWDFPLSSFISVLSWLRLSSFTRNVAPAGIHSGVWWRWKALVCACLQMLPFLYQLLKGAFLHIASHLDSLSGHKHIVPYFPCFCDSRGESCCNIGVFFSTDDLRFSPTTFNIVCLFASYFWCFEYVIDYSWLHLSGVLNISYIWMSIYFLYFFNFLLQLFHGIYCLCPQFKSHFILLTCS